MSKILITGGCGFIGSNFTEYLLEKTKWSIRILDNLSTGRLIDVKSLKDSEKRVKIIKGNISNYHTVLKAIKNCNYLVNLAAQTSVIDSIKNPFLDEEINIRGIINLLKASVENNIKKFIHASSAAALGEQKMPMNELKIPSPISPYGASKLAGEAYCSAYSGSFGLNTMVLRFSNVYGPKSYNKGSVIAKFIKEIINNGDLEIYGDGEQTRDFVYVKDICHGIYLSIIKGTMDHDVFQFGTGVETSINSLTDELKEILKNYNIKIPCIKFSEKTPGEITRSYCDITKAKKELSFAIKHKLNEGLKNTVDWFLNNYIKVR